MSETEQRERILGLIEMIWETYPSLRLGQLIANVLPDRFKSDSFYVDDDLMEASLSEFAERALSAAESV